MFKSRYTEAPAVPRIQENETFTSLDRIIVELKSLFARAEHAEKERDALQAYVDGVHETFAEEILSKVKEKKIRLVSFDQGGMLTTSDEKDSEFQNLCP